MINASRTLVAAAFLAVLSFGAEAAPTVQDVSPVNQHAGYQHMAQAVVTSKTVVRNGYRKRVVVKKKYVAPRPVYRRNVVVSRSYVAPRRHSCVTRTVVSHGIRKSTRVCR